MAAHRSLRGPKGRSNLRLRARGAPGNTSRAPARWLGWRKRMGVEPTPRTATMRGNGFEDRESHRAPCASARSLAKGRGRAARARAHPSPATRLRSGPPGGVGDPNPDYRCS